MTTTTSREYAEALFGLSSAEKQTEETLDGLVTVRSALMQTPEYRSLLASPAIGKEKRIKALEDAFRGKIPEILLAVLRMMVSRGHIAAIDEMAEEYEGLAREQRGETVAAVTSAVPLREAEMVQLRSLLEKKTGRKIILNCTVDPALIGGVRVEADGWVIDDSISNKLRKIKEVMNA
ncbi:MAG: ATP synthase F1 subunit delta [Clostridia bacterium]|nr:ATP synthase F1 subunit delta [Clostridia bacterium]